MRWTNEEVSSVLAECERLVAEDGRQYDKYWELVADAQRVLPSARRKTIEGSNHMKVAVLKDTIEKSKHKWYHRYIQKANAQVIGDKGGATEEAVAIEQTEVVEIESASVIPAPEPTLVELFAELAGRVLNHSTVRLALGNMIKDVFVQALKEDTAAKPSEAVSEGERLRLAEFLRRSTASAARERAPVVLIIGLKPDQHKPIESRYGNVLRFKWYYDESFTQLDDKARAADLTLCSMESMGHDAMDHVKMHSKHYKRVTGGTTSLLRELDRFVLENAPPPPTDNA